MKFNVEKARHDTPSCENFVHFNNAGAALMPQCVTDAVTDHILLEAQLGGYEAADEAYAKVEHVYEAASKLLNCEKHEIAVVENATRGWDMAFYSIPFKPGDRILTAVAEYASNYIAYLQVAKRTGAVVEVIPNDEFGQVSINALNSMMDERVKLISITHIPTNGGLVNPAVEIGKIAKRHNVLYLLDACQSVGQMPIDVKEINCDILTATGRKYLRGPRGTGLLYVSQNILDDLEPPFLDVHAAKWVSPTQYVIRSDARRFENWETNYAGKIGLGVAIDYALSWGLSAIQNRVFDLAGKLRQKLDSIPGVIVRDIGFEKCGIVSFTIEGHSPDKVQKLLKASGINVSVSFPEYTLLDMEARKLDSILRASVHYYNTEHEIKVFCNWLKSNL